MAADNSLVVDITVLLFLSVIFVLEQSNQAYEKIYRNSIYITYNVHTRAFAAIGLTVWNQEAIIVLHRII